MPPTTITGMIRADHDSWKAPPSSRWLNLTVAAPVPPLQTRPPGGQAMQASRSVLYIEDDEAAVALVLNVRPEALQDGGPPERLDGAGGLLRCVNDPSHWRGQLVGGQQSLCLLLVEGVPAFVQGTADQATSWGGGRPCSRACRPGPRRLRQRLS